MHEILFLENQSVTMNLSLTTLRRIINRQENPCKNTDDATSGNENNQEQRLTVKQAPAATAAAAGRLIDCSLKRSAGSNPEAFL